MEARKRDPEAQLFPEVSLDIIASGFDCRLPLHRGLAQMAGFLVCLGLEHI